ncbi:glutamyl-tRNA reductase [Catalinimonas alkaloidigena]|uniref:Glutamyl-tRNA reductase n=1 Tax=Catalinimonas alkaloidigena TaxID=1075417 RepID=A0A1G8YCK8_9BACT|nr:hypothetical protein [Catalinimonas alkaloidigena]SDK00436.1 glutamyl-tRNA reductase [Catalinimonas alkaloidigena]
MKRALRYISISHFTASLKDRERYHLTADDRRRLSAALCAHFGDVSSLMLLATCNRTELYFESAATQSDDLRDFFIRWVDAGADVVWERGLFQHSDRTADTVLHLLQVGNGLRSAVVGDDQILAQIKEAYQDACAQQRQGSLLERAIQALHRCYKRVSNETAFRQGSRSTAYRALQLIEQEFGKGQLPHKQLLIVGAGDIARQVVKYLPKFAFGSCAISNRTTDTALALGAQQGLTCWAWKNVEDQDFTAFDAIITAVSHRKELIGSGVRVAGKTVVVDLAMPGNVDRKLRFHEHIRLHDLDAVTEQIAQADQHRKAAVEQVEVLIKDEVAAYTAWLQKARTRAFLASYKHHIRAAVAEALTASVPHKLDADEAEQLLEQVARRLLKKTATAMQAAPADALPERTMAWLEAAFGASSPAEPEP